MMCHTHHHSHRHHRRGREGGPTGRKICLRQQERALEPVSSVFGGSLRMEGIGIDNQPIFTVSGYVIPYMGKT
jgi:hypothetical protein